MYDIPFQAIDKADFLKLYWQKSPCFFKQAIQDTEQLLDADSLAGLSLEYEVESRIVAQHKETGEWRTEHGPFDESHFETLTKDDWTLLVQSIDSWIPETQSLLERFSFIPRWRFDDVMASYATDNAGVGPHSDNYDVFLVQTSGKRRWRVGEKGKLPKQKQLVQGMRHLEDFQPVIDVVMEPGDMLYVPPNTAHWGISIGESVGYSVGYRAIHRKNLLSILLDDIEENHSDSDFFCDDYREKETQSNQLEEPLIGWAQQQLKTLANNPEHLRKLLSQALSHSKLGAYPQTEQQNQIPLNANSVIQLLPEVAVNWYATKQALVVNIEGNRLDFELSDKNAVLKLASYQPTRLKLFNFSPELVDFSPKLTNLIDMGYVKVLE